LKASMMSGKAWILCLDLLKILNFWVVKFEIIIEIEIPFISLQGCKKWNLEEDLLEAERSWDPQSVIWKWLGGMDFWIRKWSNAKVFNELFYLIKVFGRKEWTVSDENSSDSSWVYEIYF